MATTMTRTRRQATPERWQAALARAQAKGIQVRQLAGCGGWIATSGTDTDTAYELTAWKCECPAGAFGDPVCCHRAALLAKLGRLSLDPEPESPAPAGPAVCPTCDGHKRVLGPSHWGFAAPAYHSCRAGVPVIALPVRRRPAA